MTEGKMSLYAIVDKANHVCRDEDGKVVYDRPDHPSLDVRRFDMNRPSSKPHRVVQFDAVASQTANLYERAVIEQAAVTECVSVDGRDPSDVIRDIISWHVSLDRTSQPAEQPRVEHNELLATEILTSYRFHLYLDPNREDTEEVDLVCGFSLDDKEGRNAYLHAVDKNGDEIVLYTAQPKTATDAHVGQEPSAWLSTWHDPLHEAERTVVADACEERARKRASEVGATVEPLYTHIAPSQAVGVVDEREAFEDSCRIRGLSFTRNEGKGDDYSGPHIQAMWDGWCDRAALGRPTADQPVAAVDAKPEQAVGDGVVAFRWIYGDNHFSPWLDGKPNQAMLDIANNNERCIEYAYGTPRPAVATAGDGLEALRRELLMSPAKTNFTFTRNELIALVGVVAPESGGVLWTER